MKKLIGFSILILLLTSCNRTLLIQSSGTNPNGIPTLVDKKSKTLVSVGNDDNGFLINIRIPEPIDQYKVLKFGGYLALTFPNQNNSKAFIIAYPMGNQNKNLSLPYILTKQPTQIPMDSLLVNLSHEAGTMKIYNFYHKHILTLPSKIKDSVDADVYHEPSEKGALIYSAYIPFNSIGKGKSLNLKNSKIKIAFTSGALKVNHIYGGGPAFAPTFSYSIPRSPEERKLGIRKPSPDPVLVQKLAEPVSFDANITLTRQ